MEKLVVKPFGGLANRLLVLDSVMKLRELVKPQETVIIWERNENLNCKFSQLFKTPEGLMIKEILGFRWQKLGTFFQIYNSFDPSHYRWSVFNKIFGKERNYDKLIYSDEMEDNLTSQKQLFNLEHKSMYISFYQRFIIDRNGFYQFEPIDPLKEKIQLLTETFDSNTIGVHIRRTDHKLSINRSPTAIFIKRIKEVLEKSPEATFFLATDSEEDKSALVRSFGKCIITRDIHYSRGSKQGIEDALIDMFCLSKTSIIWGSYDSTFSQVASELGNIQHQILNKDEFVKW